MVNIFILEVRRKRKVVLGKFRIFRNVILSFKVGKEIFLDFDLYFEEIVMEVRFLIFYKV